jgi:hypothetical protein
MFGGLPFPPIYLYGGKSEIFQDRDQMLLELPAAVNGFRGLPAEKSHSAKLERPAHVCNL